MKLRQSDDAGRRVSGRDDAIAVISLQKTARTAELRGEPSLICT
jgi:hypothetical protein